MVDLTPTLPNPPGMKIKVALASLAGNKNVIVGAEDTSNELSFCSTGINCAKPAEQMAICQQIKVALILTIFMFFKIATLLIITNRR